jgi:hypothetical protein
VVVDGHVGKGKLLLEVVAEITNRRVLLGPTRNRLVAGPAFEKGRNQARLAN